MRGLGVYYHMLPPEMLGHAIMEVAETLVERGEQITPQAALYCEKMGGFQCRTCKYATAVNATHGRCAIMLGTINLDEGCCAAWTPDKEQLHLYREKME